MVPFAAPLAGFSGRRTIAVPRQNGNQAIGNGRALSRP
jgi:hypothetical protein